uniref:RNA recognition motif domain-containing protein n=1 Tax=Amorphochlora amoebiformis TaxID=1561963 RepID=A0A7S0D2P3_9EUKA|mmetsp:Transcript_18010/g.28688  ORF Transcript_18010/g.28688 Transcript_18010/m.28688 type:complete len:331 (+) Transcript_18010:183-1175(+)
MASLYDDIPEIGSTESSQTTSSVPPIWAVPRVASNLKPKSPKREPIMSSPKANPQTSPKFQQPPAGPIAPAMLPPNRKTLIQSMPRALMSKRKLGGTPNIAVMKRAKAQHVVTNVHDETNVSKGPTSGGDNKQWPFGDKVLDEYDPAKPNDYEEFVKERENKYEQEERERRNKRAKDKLRKQYERQETTMDREETGEDAYQRRVRMSQGGGAAIPPPKPQPQEAPGDLGTPSRVVLLTNMVGPGEVDGGLAGETAEECQKYGPVLKCSITEVNRVGIKEEDAVRIFVVFGTVMAARKALQDLNGRFFAGRKVKARYFPVEKFNRNELEFD